MTGDLERFVWALNATHELDPNDDLWKHPTVTLMSGERSLAAVVLPPGVDTFDTSHQIIEAMRWSLTLGAEVAVFTSRGMRNTSQAPVAPNDNPTSTPIMMTIISSPTALVAACRPGRVDDAGRFSFAGDLEPMNADGPLPWALTIGWRAAMDKGSTDWPIGARREWLEARGYLVSMKEGD